MYEMYTMHDLSLGHAVILAGSKISRTIFTDGTAQNTIYGILNKQQSFE